MSVTISNEMKLQTSYLSSCYYESGHIKRNRELNKISILMTEMENLTRLKIVTDSRL